MGVKVTKRPRKLFIETCQGVWSLVSGVMNPDEKAEPYHAAVAEALAEAEQSPIAQADLAQVFSYGICFPLEKTKRA